MNATILNQAKQVGLLVVDEGHRLKNSTGSLTLTALAGLKCDARLLITGNSDPKQPDRIPHCSQLCVSWPPWRSLFLSQRCVEFHGRVDVFCFRCQQASNFWFPVYERPISAANSKRAKLEQKTLGHAQSQALDKITKPFMLRRIEKDILKTLLPPRQELLLFCRPSKRANVNSTRTLQRAPCHRR
jgi:DNA repair and recombination RAD54-like protein